VSVDVELDIISVRLNSQKCFKYFGKVLIDKKDKKTSYEKIHANKLTHTGNIIRNKNHQKSYINLCKNLFKQVCLHKYTKTFRIYKDK